MSDSADSTHARFEVPAGDHESTADSSPKDRRPDFSCEVVVTDRDPRVFTALRYFIEATRDPSESATEVLVLDGEDPESRRIVPLAMGWGTVRTPGEPDIGYDILDDQVSLMSAHKRFLYDFVYEALDSYALIENPRGISPN